MNKKPIQFRVCNICEQRKSVRLFKRGCNTCAACRCDYYTAARVKTARSNRRLAVTVKGWGYAV